MSEETKSTLVQVQQFARLWVVAQPIVGSFVSSAIHDRADAEDVLQNVAAAAIESFHQFDAAGSFTAWVMGIARYRVLNYFRTRRRDRHVFGEAAMERIAQAHTNLEGLVDPYRTALEQCLDAMTQRQRDMLDDRYRDDLKTTEIGQRRRMSANAVTVALHRARQFLAQCIAQRIAREGRHG